MSAGAVSTRPRGAVVSVLAALATLAVLVVAPAAGAAVPAWTTYDHDPGRSAIDPDSGAPVTPTPAWSAPAMLDGEVFAQPLVSGGRVYVATENDTVYALDAATGTVIWQRTVGTPVPSGTLPCGDIDPTVGITSTPVIDPAAGRLYAVADELQNGVVHHSLVALTLATGDPVSGFPVAVDPPGADPTAILQRSALALGGGRVIIPYGGNSGDCGSYHGWLVSVPESGGTPTPFEIDPGPNEHGGAIWGAGDGPVIDGPDLFVSTGNGFGSTVSDLQESVLELDPSLNLIAHWTPANWQALDSSDLDLGSSDPVLLPGRLLFTIGKDGVGRLLSEDALGTTGQVFSAQGCSSGGGFGHSLYRAGVIYVPCSGGLAALSVSGSPPAGFTPLAGWSAPAAASGPPVYAGGLVWSTAWRNSGKTLYGLDPTTGAVRFHTDLGGFNHFATPSAGGGRLFTAAGAQVSALTIASFPPATATTLSSSANPSAHGRPVTFTATVTPAPDAGTVAFSEGSAALPGCGAVSVDPSSGHASCTATLATGSHTLVAAFSGDPSFAASSSSALIQVVSPVPPPPRLSRATLASRRFTARRGTTLRLTLSEPARVTVQMSRVQRGRRVRGRCRTNAKHGRRCSFSHRVRRLSFQGRAGLNRRYLRTRGLRPGSYTATVSARDSGGRRSRTVTLRLRILTTRR